MDENTDTIEVEVKVSKSRIIRWLFLLGCYVGCCACFWQLCHEWDPINSIMRSLRFNRHTDMNLAQVAAANYSMGKIITYAIGAHLFATLIYREHTRDTHKE